MAQITITIPDAKLQDVIDAICYKRNYQSTIVNPIDPTEMIPNPETRAQFAKRMIIEDVKDMYASYKYELLRAVNTTTENTEIANARAINIT